MAVKNMLYGIERDELAKRIRKERMYVTERASVMQAERLIERIDDKLEINVLEWMNSMPLSPVVCQGKDGCIYTIEQILGEYKGHDLLSALESMNELFLKLPDAELRLRRMYR